LEKGEIQKGEIVMKRTPFVLVSTIMVITILLTACQKPPVIPASAPTTPTLAWWDEFQDHNPVPAEHQIVSVSHDFGLQYYWWMISGSPEVSKTGEWEYTGTMVYLLGNATECEDRGLLVTHPGVREIGAPDDPSIISAVDLSRQVCLDNPTVAQAATTPAPATKMPEPTQTPAPTSVPVSRTDSNALCDWNWHPMVSTPYTLLLYDVYFWSDRVPNLSAAYDNTANLQDGDTQTDELWTRTWVSGTLRVNLEFKPSTEVFRCEAK
jgi:hypothetical protein